MAEWNKKPHPYFNAVGAIVWLLWSLKFYFENKYILAGIGLIVTILAVRKTFLDAKAIKEKGNAVVAKNT